jgi:hypothetical protein
VPAGPLRALVVLAASGLAAGAVAGCGTGPVRKPPQPAVVAASGQGGAPADTSNPSGALIACLGQRGIKAHPTGPDDVAVDPPEAGMHVRFLGTDGDAQAAQLHGDAEGAEVILNALVFVGRGTDEQVQPVESCTAKAAK